MFRFATPEYLYLLFLLPIILFLFLGSKMTVKRRIQKLGDDSLISKLIVNNSTKLSNYRFILIIIAIVGFTFLLSRPQFGTKSVEGKKTGIELAIALDVSNSMLADDIKPSRLERSKLLLTTLLSKLDGHQVSTTVFAGEAYLQIPMTNDLGAVEMMINGSSTDLVTYQGTNMQSALQLAKSSFSSNRNVGKVVLLVTDGEDHEEGALEEATELKKMGIKLIVIGVGTEIGSYIKIKNEVLKDEERNPVVSKFNKEACINVAKASDGTFFHINEHSSINDALINEFEKLQTAENTYSFTEPNEQFQLITIVILIILIIESFLIKPSKGLLRRIHPSIVVLFFSLPVSSQTESWIEMNKGYKTFREKNYRNSGKHYGTAVKVDSLNSNAYFGLANSLMSQNNVDSAIISYNKVIELNNDKQTTADAHHNLGFIYQTLAGNTTDQNEKQKLLKTAISNYQETLRNYPMADDSRYNMVLCLKQLKDSQQQSKQQQQNNNNQKNENKNDSTKQKRQPNKTQQQPQPTPTKKQSEKILDFSRRLEQKTKDKIKAVPIRRYKNKYW